MANNPYVNKVVYNNNTLIDITDTTATASDVVSGKDFYTADGSKTSGTLIVPQILYGTTVPTSSLGNDGDLYIKIEE